MRKPLKISFSVAGLAVAVIGLFAAFRKPNAGPGYEIIKAANGKIVEKALAIGQIVPRQEIQVKSQISGLVKQCFVEVGDRVKV